MAKILTIGKFYYPFRGGIEANAQSIAEAAAVEHDVTVLANNHDGGDCVDIINNVTVIRKKVHLNIKNQPISLRLLHGIRLSQFDLIHFHGPNPYAAFALCVGLFGLKSTPRIVVTHHMDIFGRRLLRAATICFYRKLLTSARSVIVTSMKNAAISRDLPADINAVAIPLGIDPDRYVLTDEIRERGRNWRVALAGGAPVVGFLGRHARYKGLDVLIDAVALIPELHVIIAGDGPQREPAENHAAKLAISERVHFVGKLDEPGKLEMLAAIDVFAFPSTEVTEAFGVSQMEAMICGVPVVATDLPTGVTDVAIHEKTALLAEVGSARSLAAQIRRCLDDQPFSREMASRGRAHILDGMTEVFVAGQTRAKLEAALSKGERRDQ